MKAYAHKTAINLTVFNSQKHDFKYNSDENQI
jgi:hypothetical protein